LPYLEFLEFLVVVWQLHQRCRLVVVLTLQQGGETVTVTGQAFLLDLRGL